MVSIVDELSDCFPDTLIAQPGTLDETGAFTASGEALSMPAYFSGRARMIRDAAGREVVSTLKATVGVTAALVTAWVNLGWTGWVNEDWVSGSDAFPSILTTDTYRYTLPVRFAPRVNLTALSVQHSSDEDGAHHESVYFP